MMLEIQNLSVNYGHVEAIKRVSLQVEQGKIVTIIGANGAGKSTLLKAISGLERYREGEILFQGAPLPFSSYKIVRKGIIQVPEGRRVFAGLTVYENLIMGGIRIPAKEAGARVREVLEIFPRLEERIGQYAGTLSGGEQQMLALARGMMAKPSLLLLDEPSLGLAPIIVEQVFELIKTINRMGITILLVEQNAQKALSISDYTYVLETGEIVMQGPSAELIEDPGIQKAYLGG